MWVVMGKAFKNGNSPHSEDNEMRLDRRGLRRMCTPTSLISKSFLPWITLALYLLLFSGIQVFAQVDQGTITGVVQDNTGAVIPDAQVTLTSTDTGLVLQTKSDNSGVYTFSPIKIGNYRVSATAPGFETTSQDNLHLNMQERLNVVLNLKPGAVSQTVTVSTAPPLLQTQSSSVGQVMSTRTINDVPLNGRNWVFVAQLAAGVAPSSGNSRGSATGDFFANGQIATQNNFILDGVDNNTNLADLQSAASFVVRPPPDALAEFKVDTSDYSAEFGHSAGAVINASLKSGTNQIHGDFWEYFRNNVLDARDFNALTVPEYRENQFGATLGLPLIKNKLFFFGDVEANRIVLGQPTTITVPTPLMRQGNFTELLNTGLTGSSKPIQLYQPNSGGTATLSCNGQNNIFCPQQIDSTAQNILKLYPMPNTNAGKTYNNYTTNLKQLSDTWQWDARMDWNISAKDQAYSRFSYLHIPAYITPPLGTILDGANNYDTGYDDNLSESFMFSESHLFTPTLTNEFRVGYDWGAFSFLQVNYGTDLAARLGLGGIPYGAGFPDNGGLPQGVVRGINDFGSHSYDPSIEHQNVYQILDNVTKIIGGHSLKFGVDLQSIRFSILQPAVSRGQYTFSGLYTSNLGKSFTGFGVADFLSDQIDAASISNESSIGDARWYDAGYAQDDWRINAKVTLNLGIRYELTQTYKEVSGRQATYHVTGPLGVATGSAVYQIPVKSRNVPLASNFTTLLSKDNITLQYVNNLHLIDYQKTNFSPRMGFAYATDAKTVIRGGFGIFYGGLVDIGGADNLGNNYPFSFTDNFSAPNCGPNNCPSTGLTLENGFSTLLAAGLQNFVKLPTMQGSDPLAKTPYAMDYNLTIQRSLSNDIAASVGYVGSVSRHLETKIDFNNPEALQNPANSAQFVRPFPDFSGTQYMNYAGESSYNSFQGTLQKRYANGLDFLATYTWSHSLDDSIQPLGGYGGPYRNTNLVPITDDYSNSEFDVRQRFTFNGFYQLPFGAGRTHMNHPGIANIIAGDWAADLTFSAETGQPFNITPDISTASGGNAFAIVTQHNYYAPGGTPNATNPSVTCAAHTKNTKNWYNPCAFSNPLPGSTIPRSGAGSLVSNYSQVLAYLGGKRNEIYGPGYERIDMSIFKNFPTYHSQYLEFRTDIFNVLNTPAYGNPSVTNDNTNGGQITTARSFQAFMPDARFFQFSAKYVF